MSRATLAAGPQTDSGERLSGLAISVGLIALIGPTVVSAGWVEDHLALRFMLIVAELGLGLPCLVRLARRGVERGYRWPALVGGFFAAWAVVSSLASGHPGFSMLGPLSDGTGALFAVALVATWALGVAAGAAAGELVTRALMCAAIANGGAAILETLVNLASVDFGLFDNRALGLFANPVYGSALMAAGSWLLMCRMATDSRWSAAIVVVAAGVQLTGSRTGLATLGLVAIGGFVALPFRRAAAGVAALLVGLALAVGVGHVSSIPSGARVTGTTRIAGDLGVTARRETWVASYHALVAKPVLGYGPGLVQAATAPRTTLALRKSVGPDAYFVQAHDLFIEYAVTTGVPGALLLLGFVVLVIRSAGWRTPLAGFGLLVLAAHALEPNNVVLTTVGFLALGAAAPAPLVPVRRVRSWLVGVAAAMCAAVPISVGAAEIRITSHDVASARDHTGLARRLLPVWAAPEEQSELLWETVGAVTSSDEAYRAALGYELQAVQREPYQAQDWWHAGAIALRLDRVSDAERYFRKALRADPWQIEALRDLSTVLVHTGRKVEGLHDIGLALQAAPGDASLEHLEAAEQAM